MKCIARYNMKRSLFFKKNIYSKKIYIYLHGNTLQMLLKLMDYTWEKIEC